MKIPWTERCLLYYYGSARTFRPRKDEGGKGFVSTFQLVKERLERVEREDQIIPYLEVLQKDAQNACTRAHKNIYDYEVFHTGGNFNLRLDHLRFVQGLYCSVTQILEKYRKGEK